MRRLLPALLALFLAALPLRAQVPSAINVEIDYMVGTWHSHEPARSEIDAVVQMFACQGITLNVVIDDALPHRDVLRRDPDDGDNFFDYDDGPDTFGYLKRNFFDNDGGPWHYAVFGHQYQNDDYQTTSSSGLGEKPGDDFIVTLGDFDNDVGTAWDRAATFAHELGHNLGLGHAGAMDPAVVGSYVPNVPSVMSYFYQLTGVRAAMRCKGLISADADETLYKNLDYSHGRACDLDEGALDEPRGMGIVPVDWDCDGTIGGTVSQDLGEQDASWCGSDADKDYLEDLNEWNVLVDVAQMPASMRPEPEIVSCVTAEEIAAAMSPCACTTSASACTSETLRSVS